MESASKNIRHVSKPSMGLEILLMLRKRMAFWIKWLLFSFLWDCIQCLSWITVLSKSRPQVAMVHRRLCKAFSQWYWAVTSRLAYYFWERLGLHCPPLLSYSGHILFWKRLQTKMKYFEDFTLSLKSSETPLCVPKTGLGITDLDPVLSLQHLEGPIHDKKNWAGSLLIFWWCQQPMALLQLCKQLATQFHIWSPSHASQPS